MRVSILIMAFLPPFRAFTSASSARVAASLHWASKSFLSFSRFMASSCSQRSSSARRAASTIARAALSSDSLASLVISSRSLFSWPSSPSSFLLEAVMDWLTLVMSARVSLVSASSCSAALVGVHHNDEQAGVGVDQLGLVVGLQVPEDRSVVEVGQVDHVLALLKLGGVDTPDLASLQGELLVRHRNGHLHGEVSTLHSEVSDVARLEKTFLVAVGLGV